MARCIVSSAPVIMFSTEVLILLIIFSASDELLNLINGFSGSKSEPGLMLGLLEIALKNVS